MPESSFPQPISEQLEELMAGYILNTLSPEEYAEFELYLQENPALSTNMSHLYEIMGLIAHVAPPLSAPTHLRHKILKAAQPSVSSSQVRRKFDFPWERIAIAVVTVLLLVIGIDNYFLRRKLASSQTSIMALQQSESHQRQNLSLMEATVSALQGHETLLFALRGTNAAAKASGSVILDLEAGVALIALRDLPPLDKGDSYHLWAFTADKKIACGTFKTNSSGQIVDKIPVPIEEYTSPVVFMRISRESSTKPVDPTKKVLVMTSESMPSES